MWLRGRLQQFAAWGCTAPSCTGWQQPKRARLSHTPAAPCSYMPNRPCTQPQRRRTLDDAAGHHAHSVLRHQLDTDARRGVGGLEVVDQLGQVCGRREWWRGVAGEGCVSLRVRRGRGRAFCGAFLTRTAQLLNQHSGPALTPPPLTLNRVDVVVGRRRNEAHARRGVTRHRDVALGRE